jgi:hypothetical protein
MLHQMAAEPYEARGILHSEAALLVVTCQALGITHIVESGRARGQSTYMLGKYLSHVQVLSIEKRADHPDEAFARERLKELPNVRLALGDGKVDLVPAVMGIANMGNRVAVLCDGPKGHEAIELVDACLKHPYVRVGFIHDMRRLDHGAPSPYRAAAEARFEESRFTDDPEYVRVMSWMDENIAKAGGPCGPDHEKVFGSYGPTIGAFFNPKQ